MDVPRRGGAHRPAVPLTYSPEDDRLYGLGIGRDGNGNGRPCVIEFAPGGAVTRRVDLVEAPALGLERHAAEGAVQIAAAGRQLALLTLPLPDLNDPDLVERPLCLLIDPRTGRITYAGASEPHAGDPVAVAAEELDALWRLLADGDPAEADAAMWKMAAAGDPAVALVRAKLPPIQTPDLAAVREQVRVLIAELNDEDFRVRDRASEQLRRMGGGIEPELRKALLADDLPAATKQRLDAVIARVRKDLIEAAGDPPDDPDPDRRREQRAVHVLGRLGSPAAVELLRELAAGPAGVPRTHQAQAALQRLGRQ